ncbi:hypothetical protein KW797_02200, partial [Candidatus Parcubacteria bacterium]|nr:hypothetical protein [Candidatus Parcubacteria bacterium]
ERNLTSRIMKMGETYSVTGKEWLLKHSYASKYLDNFEFSKAADEIFERVKSLDGFIQKNEPFKKIKKDPEGAKKDIGFLTSELALIAFELKPFLPESFEKILAVISSGKMPEKPLFPRIEK